MITPIFIAASAFALQAAAFLVPPEVAEAANPPSDAYHLSTFKDPKSDVYALPCTGCPLASGSGPREDITWIDGVENALSLNFTIDDEHNALLLNDRPIYPLVLPVSLELFAHQIEPVNHGDIHPYLRLAFALATFRPIEPEDESGTTLTPMHLTIVDIAGKPVNLDTVRIDLLKLPTGELFIGNVDLLPAPEEAPGAECTNQLCRLRAIILARIHAMLEAARSRAHKAGKLIKGGCHKMNSHRGGHRAHEMGHGEKHRRPHHHEAHHRHHSIVRFVDRTMKVFVIPAILGVVGGLVASIIGMMVGQGLVYVWYRFVRGNQRGPYARVALIEEADEDDKEDDIEVESPPKYEELDGTPDIKDDKE